MNRKRIYYRLAVMITMVTVVILSNRSAYEAWHPLLSAGIFYGAEKAKLPHLIQTTTLEEDYKALAELELAVTPLLSEEDFEKAFENVLCSCVRIETREHYGSGSIYKMREDEIVIVTNRHVLADWDEDSHVTFFNGAAGFGEVMGISDEADVGFLRISTAGFPYEELLTFRNVRIPSETEKTEEAAERADAVEGRTEKYFCIDMANYFETPVMEMGEIVSTSVYLDDFGMEMFYGAGSAVPGMSGSGIFDGYGNYLGMLTGATVQGEIAALPTETVCREYERF